MNSVRNWAVVGILLFGTLLAGCDTFTSSFGPQEKTNGDSVVVEVNSKAPAFAARTLDGGSLRLADYLGSHVVLLEFWSIFCKSCIQEMPHVEDIYARYRDEGLAVLSVNTDVFSSEKVAKFLRRAGIDPPYPIVRDQRQELVKAFGVEVLPVTVILDRDGWIRLYQEGYRPGDEDTFESKIRSLLRRRGNEDATLASRDGVTAFAPPGSQLAELGTQVPGLSGQTLSGETVQVGEGMPQLLYFWSLYCNPCRAELPEVAELSRRYGNRGVQVTAVNVDSKRLEKRVARFIQKHPGLPCVLDDGSAGAAGLTRALGVRATPTLVLLDGQGRVGHVATGAVETAAVEKKILDLLDKP